MLQNPRAAADHGSCCWCLVAEWRNTECDLRLLQEMMACQQVAFTCSHVHQQECRGCQLQGVSTVCRCCCCCSVCVHVFCVCVWVLCSCSYGHCNSLCGQCLQSQQLIPALETEISAAFIDCHIFAGGCIPPHTNIIVSGSCQDFP
jgi:hypothetical protein